MILINQKNANLRKKINTIVLNYEDRNKRILVLKTVGNRQLGFVAVTCCYHPRSYRRVREATKEPSLQKLITSVTPIISR